MIQDKYGQKGSVCLIGFKATQSYMISHITKIIFHSCHIRDEFKLRKKMVEIFFIIFFASFFSEVWSAGKNLYLQRGFTAHAFSRPGVICSN